MCEALESCYSAPEVPTVRSYPPGNGQPSKHAWRSGAMRVT
jgi:hypothetical protein